MAISRGMVDTNMTGKQVVFRRKTITDYSVNVYNDTVNVPIGSSSTLVRKAVTNTLSQDPGSQITYERLKVLSEQGIVTTLPTNSKKFPLHVIIDNLDPSITTIGDTTNQEDNYTKTSINAMSTSGTTLNASSDTTVVSFSLPAGKTAYVLYIWLTYDQGGTPSQFQWKLQNTTDSTVLAWWNIGVASNPQEPLAPIFISIPKEAAIVVGPYAGTKTIAITGQIGGGGPFPKAYCGMLGWYQ